MRNFENFVGYVGGINVDTCNRHLRSQNSVIDLNNIDYLGRMETFGDDLQHIFQRLELDTTAIKSRNVTSDRKPYQEYYTSELAEQVARIYRKDVQIFGYRF
ncbi:MAG: sulfotransferase family 2 domain-containing protein, partial [Gammaproteobacteria bacterium]|nr:sulfotransferase family 2 domain-containing protein [Gammaproteobacteria bacterium]